MTSAQILDFTAAATGLGQIKNGLQALAERDAIEQDNRGLAWKAQVTDYAAIATVATTVVAETSTNPNNGALWDTSVCSSQRPTLFSHPVTRDFYDAFPTGVAAPGDGVTIERRNALGAVLATNVLVNTGTLVYDCKFAGLLSNGNLLFSANKGGTLNHWVLDPKSLKTLFTVATEAITTSGGHDTIVLSGGGFAAAYLKSGTATDRLDIRNNDCTVNVAVFTTITWTGAASGVTRKLVQLSNANIGVAFASNYATNGGLYSAIYQTNGTVVQAPRQDSATLLASSTSCVEIAVITGFWAYNCPMVSTTGNKTIVLDNTGAIQGTILTRGGTQAAGPFITTLMADLDSLQFWLSDINSGDAFFSITQIPTTGGAGAVTYKGPNTGTGQIHSSMYDRGKIVTLLTNSNGLKKDWAVFDAINKAIEKSNTAIGTNASATDEAPIGVCATGDWTFLMSRAADGTGKGTSIISMKYASSAVKGAAFTAITANALGYFRSTGAGNVAINAIGGSPSVAVDHSATTPAGIKGSISLNSMYM